MKRLLLSFLFLGLSIPAIAQVQGLGASYVSSAGACLDKDGDGYGVGPLCAGPDADDNDATVHSTADIIGKYVSMNAYLISIGYQSGVSPATVWCISPTGSNSTGAPSTNADTACTTPYANWSGLSAAHISQPYIVIYRGGTYSITANSQILQPPSGTSGRQSYVIGYPGEKFIFNSTISGSVINLADATDYVTIDCRDGYINGADHSNDGIALGRFYQSGLTEHGITVRRCEGSNFTTDGAIAGDNLTDVLIEENVGHDPTVLGMAHCIYLGSNSQISTNVNIRRNICYNSFDGNWPPIQWNGRCPSGCHIDQNIIFNTDGQGISLLEGFANGTIDGNLVFNLGNNGNGAARALIFYDYDGNCGGGTSEICPYDQTNNIISNNTFWVGTKSPVDGSTISNNPAVMISNQTTAAGSCTHLGLSAPCGNLGGNKYINNIIVGSGPVNHNANSGYPPFDYINSNPTATNYAAQDTFQNNIINSQDGSTFVIGIGPGTNFGFFPYDCTGVAAKVLVPPSASACSSSNPAFFNANVSNYNQPGLFDFHIQSTSPARGAGTATGAPAFDVDGNAYGNPPSIGALEFVVPTGAPGITSSLTATAQVGTAFNYTITATNQATSFNATNLPANLMVNTSTGVISGTPTSTAGSPVTIPLSATNVVSTGNANLVLTINPPTPVINSSLTASTPVGSLFSYTITASNGPASFNATGLPSGLNIDTSTGIISGTPATTSGSPFTIGLSATNAGGTGTANLVLTVTAVAVPVVTSSSTSVNVGTVLNFQIAATNTPASFNATNLPSGLSVNTTTGVISGTLAGTAGSPVTINLSATNSVGPGNGTLTLTINPAGTPMMGWQELSNTKVQSVCPPNGFGNPSVGFPTVYPFSTSCAKVFTAWGGGTADTMRDRLVIWGGGHVDYDGNELYSLNLTPLRSNSPATLTRLTNPSPIDLIVNDVASHSPAALSDGNPDSRHTYNNLAYLTEADRMYAFSGGLAPVGDYANDTWTLDLSQVVSPTPVNTPAGAWHSEATAAQIALSPIGVQSASIALATPDPNHPETTTSDPNHNYNPQTNCQITDGVNCKLTLESATGAAYAAAEFDPNTQTVFLRANGINWSYQYETNTYGLLTRNDSSKQNVYMTPVIDPHRGLFILMGTNGTDLTPHVWAFSIAYGSNYAVQDWTSQVTGCNALAGSPAPGLAYDPVLDAVVGWPSSGNTIYIFNPDTKTCTTTNFLNGPLNAAPTFNGVGSVYGRFRYFRDLNAYAVSTSYSTNAFLLQLNTTAPSSDVTAPTVSISQPTGPTVSGVVTVAANASDNVGVTAVRFFLDGAILGTEVTSAPFQVSLNTNVLTNGSKHVITAIAKDTAGNTAEASPVTVTVSNNPSQIVITSGNSQTGTVGQNLGNPFVATVEDSSGNPVAGVPVTFAVQNGAGTLVPGACGNPCSSSVTAGQVGQASITLQLGHIAGSNNNTVTASFVDSSLVTHSVTFTASAQAGAAAALAFVSPTLTNLSSGSTRTFTAKATDQFGNTATSFTGSVTFSASAGPGTLSGLPQSVNATVGQAITSALTGVLAGNVTVHISGPGVTSPADISFNVVGAAATAVEFVSPDTTNLTSGTQRTFTARVRDAGGNTVTNFVGNISFSTLAGPGTVSGLSSIAVSNGQAQITVTGILAGSITLQASSTGLTSGTAGFTIGGGAATAVEYVNPDSSSLGSGSVRLITARIRDAAGNTVTGFVGSIAFALQAGPGSVTGLQTVAVANGQAAVSVTGGSIGGITVRASSGALATADLVFSVILGSPTAVEYVAPDNSALVSGSQRTFTARVRDAAGNTVTGYNGSITFAVQTGPGSLTGLQSVAVSNGQALITVTGALAGSVTLRATSSSLTAATVTFNVAVGPVSAVEYVNPDTSSLGSGGVRVLTARIRDAAGNTVTSYAGSITYAVQAGPGSVTGVGAVVVNNGQAQVSVTGAALGSVTVRASSGALAPADLSFAIIVGNPTAVEFVSPDLTNMVAGTQRTFTVRIRDTAGTTIVGYSGSVNFTMIAGSGSVSGLQQVAVSNGQAQIALTGGLTGSATIQASSSSLSVATITLTIVAGAPTAVRIVSPDTSDLPSQSVRLITARIVDAGGNGVTSFAGSITFTPLSGPGTATGLPQMVTVTSGNATVSITGDVQGAITIQAASGSLVSDTLSFNISAALPGSGGGGTGGGTGGGGTGSGGGTEPPPSSPPPTQSNPPADPPSLPSGQNVSLVTLQDGTVQAQPSSLEFTGSGSTSVTDSPSALVTQSVRLADAGNSADWSASVTTVSGGGWLTVSPTSGFTPVSLTVKANAASLTPGIYESDITIRFNKGTRTTTIPVFLKLLDRSALTLALTPPRFYFNSISGGAPASKTLVISDAATSVVGVTVGTSSQWLTASPANGGTPLGVTVVADPAGLAPGSYTGNVVVAAGSASLSVPVQFDVQPPQPASVVATPETFVVDTVQGGTPPAPLTLNIANGGSGGFSWQASTTTDRVGPKWLSVSPASGSGNGTAAIAIDTSSLAPGQYRGTVDVGLNGGASTDSSWVIVNVAASGAAVLGISPAALSFQSSPDSQPPAAQTITVNSTPAASSWSANATTSGGGSWLVVSPLTGSTPGTANVSVSTIGLAPGTYTGTIEFSGAGAAQPQVVPVTLVVRPSGVRPALWAEPGSVVFTSVNGSDPASQTVNLWAAPALQLAWTTTVTTSDGAGWLTATPAAGSAPGMATLTAKPDGLAPGVYTGAVAFSSTTANNWNVLVPVTFVVNTFAAAGSPASVAFLHLPNNFQSPVGVTLAIEAMVRDASGQPVMGASVTAYTTTGDTIPLREIGGGNYGASWAPPAAGAIGIRVTAAKGSQTASASTSGSIVSLGADPPIVFSGGVVSAANFPLGPAPVAPGSVLSLYGLNLAGVTQSTVFPLPYNLGTTSVSFDNMPAPIFFGSEGQLNVQVPYEIDGRTRATLRVVKDNMIALSVNVPISSVAPTLFSADGTGRGSGAILHGDGSLVSPALPARAQEEVAIYATGLGTVSPKIATGAPGPPVALYTAALPIVTVGGIPAPVTFSGLAPGYAGLYQVNIKIPDEAGKGPSVPIVLRMGNLTSDQTTIAIQ